MSPCRRTPAEVGLDYEPVAFRASDGVGIKGWFIPRGRRRAQADVVFVHGWMWNRLGNVAGHVPIDDRDVDFLPVTKALHDAGYSVLLYDIRKHGESESGKGLLSFGPLEKYDFIGAVNYLRSRADVDGERIGSLGISMGGTIALYGAPECQPIKSILAVQPSKVTDVQLQLRAATSSARSARDRGRRSSCSTGSRKTPPPSAQDPGAPAQAPQRDDRQVRAGHGRPLGHDGRRRLAFAEGTPTLDGPVVHYPSSGRYDGYRYVSAETEDIVDFFRRTL